MKKTHISDSLTKCAIDNKCLQKSAIEATNFYNTTIKIATLYFNKKKLNDKEINTFVNSYKKLEKIFFEKKTVECIKKYCSKFINNKITQLEKIIIKLNYMKETLKYLKKNTKTKISLNKIQNSQKIINTVLKMAKSFYKNFNKNFKQI